MACIPGALDLASIRKIAQTLAKIRRLPLVADAGTGRRTRKFSNGRKKGLI